MSFPNLELLINLSILLGAYLLVILIFGTIYWWINRYQAGAFHFNQAIVDKAKYLSTLTNTNNVNKKQNLLTGLNLLLANLKGEGGNELFLTLTDIPEIKSPYGGSCKSHEVKLHPYIFYCMNTDFEFEPVSMSASYLIICNTDNNSVEEVLLQRNYVPGDYDDFISAISSVKTRVVNEIARSTKNLAEIDNVEYSNSKVFNIVDFWYFSFITQTTVGYGEIVPNSYAVRGLVVLQVFVGYFFLVVLLNLILAN